MAAIKNRRRGPDTMVKMITAFSICSWIVIVAAFSIYQMSNPSGSYNSVRNSLLKFENGIIIAKVLLFLNFLICVWGMVINMARNKRKSDRFRLSLIVSCIISLTGFILMVIFL
jgi:hypothetical protein